MADYVSIANLAASKLGEDDQMRSPEDDSHIGRSIRAVWDMVRRAVLRDHAWNFAIKRARIAAIVTPETLYPFEAAFQLPDDHVRLLELVDVARSAYQIEGRRILASVGGPVNIRYVADIDRPALWDDLFVEAVACRLSFQIADRITGDRGRKADAWDAYRAALASAKRVDALENPPVAWEATEWEMSRFRYSGERPFGPRTDAAGSWRDPVV